MEVLAGSAFGIEVPPPSAAAAAYGVATSSQEEEIVGRGTFIGSPADDSSDSSSSIETLDGSDEEEGEEAESATALNSLDSIEESLPIKRGLSNHFTGKSKSFASLADVVTSSSSITAKDLEKPENPFNKRRRLLLANKWARKSFYNWSNPKSMPLLTLNEEDEPQEQNQRIEEDDEDDDEEEEEEGESQVSRSSSSSEHEILKNQARFLKIQEVKFKRSFKSHSCFSLTDLQHEEFQ